MAPVRYVRLVINATMVREWPANLIRRAVDADACILLVKSVLAFWRLDFKKFLIKGFVSREKQTACHKRTLGFKFGNYD